MTTWFQSLATRERQFVVAGAAVVTLVLVYALVYAPLQDSLSASKISLENKLTEFKQLRDISLKYKRIGPSKSRSTTQDGRSLLAVIDQSSSSAGIKSAIKRLTPEGASKVRVRVEEVAFDKLVEWLASNSSKNLIHAELFLVRQTETKGMVNATLLLARK
jgi:general secretion pathway protein M